MNLQVSTEAAEWYQKELSLQPLGHLRFFPRYGFGGHIPGFAIGINKEEPDNIYVKAEVNEITFYIETKDAWYFEDIETLEISYDESLDEPKLDFKEVKD